MIDDSREWRRLVHGRAASSHRVLETLEQLLAAPDSVEIGERLGRAWAGRTFGIYYERPLLVLAALRFDALANGTSHPLWPVLGATDPDPDRMSRAALVEALRAESFWQSLEKRFVQTNETSRAVAWLWPVQLAGCDAGARPLVLIELGCSAGLNLVTDRLPSIWTDRNGDALPTVREPRIVRRVGIDRRPLDVRDPDALAWMRACIWAGEHARLSRFEAAVAAFVADPPELMTGDAAQAGELASEIASRASDAELAVVFQTIIRDYLDPETDAAYDRGLREFLAERPNRAAWLELELRPSTSGSRHPAAIIAHVANARGVIEDLELGRASYHPAEVEVDEAATERFRELVTGA